MSPAENIFYRKFFEVHSGADPVNSFSRIRVIYVTDFKRGLKVVLTRVEPRITSSLIGTKFFCAFQTHIRLPEYTSRKQEWR